MPNHKNSMISFGLLALTAIIISACERPYGTETLVAPDTNPTNLFVEPLATNAMEIIENFATGTAMASDTEVALTGGVPAVTEGQGTEITPDSNAPATNTLESSNEPTSTPTLGNVNPTSTQPAPTVITNRPGTYTLQKGEFPYCIARRFNVDPAELLSLNGLTNGEIYYPNLTMTMPSSGKPFPGTRALRSHPATYTVIESGMTLYGVACEYGDVDPAAIVQVNPGLSLASTLTVGQSISIP